MVHGLKIHKPSSSALQYVPGNQDLRRGICVRVPPINVFANLFQRNTITHSMKQVFGYTTHPQRMSLH